MYEDNTVRADETGVTVSRYGLTRSKKRIGYDQISSAEMYDMGVMGRWRLVGAGPTRIRNWYNWDPSRRTKTKAIAFDTGGFFHPTVTPDDAEAFVAVISDHVTVI